MSKTVKDHLDFLGHEAVDRITQFHGVVASVYFSIDGYIHLNLTPQHDPSSDKKGDASSKWFDANRVELLHEDAQPVMAPPMISYDGPNGDAIDVRADLGTLGHMASDPVTGAEGIITGVAFDLYGCVQGAVTPKAKDGEVKADNWFHLTRLNIEKKATVTAPNFMPQKPTRISSGNQGPAPKPAFERPR